MRRIITVLLAALLGVSAFASDAEAHEPTITRASAVFAADGTYRIEMACDFDALLLGMKPGRLSEDDYARLRAIPKAEFDLRLDRLRSTFDMQVRPLFDGVAPDRKVISVDFPEFAGAQAGASPSNPIMGRLVVLSGRTPTGARSFALSCIDAFDWINLTVAHAGSDAETTDAFKGGQPSGEYPLQTTPVRSSLAHIIAEYLVLGYEHIVPKGLDHILFVLGLYLLSPKLKPLLMQLTAFTIAHSITLALSMTGVFSLPASIVEPAIAASIAYVAIENIARSELKATRTVVVFLFGLVHGLGFAGVLSELGLPRGAFLPALVSFNVGVELGQISVVLGALLVTGWFRNRAWYRVGAVIPASCAIAAVGLYWAVERAVAG